MTERSNRSVLGLDRRPSFLLSFSHSFPGRGANPAFCAEGGSLNQFLLRCFHPFGRAAPALGRSLESFYGPIQFVSLSG